MLSFNNQSTILSFTLHIVATTLCFAFDLSNKNDICCFHIAVHDIIATTNNPWLEFRAIYEGNIIKLGLWCKQMRQEIV